MHAAGPQQHMGHALGPAWAPRPAAWCRPPCSPVAATHRSLLRLMAHPLPASATNGPAGPAALAPLPLSTATPTPSAPSSVPASTSSPIATPSVPQQITRHNFASSLPAVRAALQSCAFFALDCEFSGLTSDGGGIEQYYDDSFDRYARMRNGCRDFLVVQFGLSAFEWCPSSQRYLARTFNFWVYPRPEEDGGARDVRFKCQASSLVFLASQGFDFNRWINDGIAYVALRAPAKPPPAPKGTPSTSLPAPAARQATPSSSSSPSSLSSTRAASSTSPGGEASLLRSSPSPPSRPASSDNLTSATGDGTAASGKPEPEGTAAGTPRATAGTVGTFSSSSSSTPPPPPAQLSTNGSATNASGAADFPGTSSAPDSPPTSSPTSSLASAPASDAGDPGPVEGFSHVVQLMRDCGRPAVVHNGGQDILCLMHQFVGPLPEHWDEYKALVLPWFTGGVYDTKYIARQLLPMQHDRGLFGNISLGAVHASLLPSGAAGRLFSQGVGQAEGAGRDGEAVVSVTLPEVEHALGYDLYRLAVPEEEAAESSLAVASSGDLAVLDGGSDGDSDGEGAAAVLPAPAAGESWQQEAVRLRQQGGGDGSPVHEAGYDAFVTGTVFARLLALAQLLGSGDSGSSASSTSSASTAPGAPSAAVAAGPPSAKQQPGIASASPDAAAHAVNGKAAAATTAAGVTGAAAAAAARTDAKASSSSGGGSNNGASPPPSQPAVFLPLGPVRPWSNRLHVMRSDLPYVALAGPDSEPQRPDVFHVSGMLPYTKVAFVQAKFEEAGLGKVQVTFSGGRTVTTPTKSAFVRLVSAPELALHAVEALGKLRCKWLVVPYWRYYEARQAERGKRVRAAAEERRVQEEKSRRAREANQQKQRQETEARRGQGQAGQQQQQQQQQPQPQPQPQPQVQKRQRRW